MLRHHSNLRNNHGVILWALLTFITICLVCGVMYLVYDEINYYHKEGVWKNETSMPLKKFFIKNQDEGVVINTQAFAIQESDPILEPPPIPGGGDSAEPLPDDPAVDPEAGEPSDTGGADESLDDLFAPPN